MDIDKDMTLYTWEDDQAPIISDGNEEASRLEILYQCLVTGYGDKPPAGWEEVGKERDGEDRLEWLCIRQPDSPQHYVRAARGQTLRGAIGADNNGATNDDLHDYWTNATGTETPDADEEVWLVLADSRSFLLYYKSWERQGVLEGAIDVRGIHRHMEPRLAVSSRDQRKQLAANIGSTSFEITSNTSTNLDHDHSSGAINGVWDSPHYRTFAPYIAMAYQSEWGRSVRWSPSGLHEGVIAMTPMILMSEHNSRTVPISFLPNIRYLLTGFERGATEYTAENHPGVGERIRIKGKAWRVVYAGDHNERDTHWAHHYLALRDAEGDEE